MGRSVVNRSAAADTKYVAVEWLDQQTGAVESAVTKYNHAMNPSYDFKVAGISVRRLVTLTRQLLGNNYQFRQKAATISATREFETQ